jgi:hypothetical protein
VQYAGFSAWKAAVGGTYSRASTATYLSSGVVQTATSGNPRFLSTGLRLTGAQTELCLWNRDLTNAAWTASNVTVAHNQVGADGTASAASSLTATAGNGTVLQAITSASQARVMGAYVKRITGTGTINITQDNGGTWTSIVPTASWSFYSLPSATVANPTVGFQIVTNGDVIAVDFVSERIGLVIPDVIPTTTVSAAQAADSLTTIGTSGTANSVLVNVTMDYASAAASGLDEGLWGFTATTSGTIGMDRFSADMAIRGTSLNADTGLTLTAAPTSIAAAMQVGDVAVVKNGGAPYTSSTLSAMPSAPLGLKLGLGGNGVAGYATFQQIAVWQSRISNGALQAVS